MKSKLMSYCTRASRVALLGSFVLLLLAGSAAAQREFTKEITVPGESGLKWVDTGITVAAGDTVRLEAEGTVDVGSTWGVHGPEGSAKFAEQPAGYYPLETARRYGLAARITLGSGRKYQPTQTWMYTEGKDVKVTRSGMLWLTVNDDAPEGNVGEFVVKITVIKKKQ